MATTTPRTPSPRGRDAPADAPHAPLWGPRHDDQDTGGSRRSRRHTSNPFSSANAGKATTPENRRAHRENASFPSPPASPTRARGISTPKQARSKKTARFADHLNAPNRFDNGALLLTPVKTPKASTPPSTGTSRTVVFQHGDPRDAMPTPRKMKGAMRGSAKESFEIHTDWNARRPTIDLSEDNAFIGERIGSSKNQNRLRTASPKPLEANMSDEEMQQRVNNDEGLIFSFRGKKVYRPYEDSVTDIALAEALGYQPIRRSSGRKPAVLDFTRLTSDSHVNANDTDEEALTDIEAGNAIAEANDQQASSQPRTSSQSSTANSRAGGAFFSWPRTKPEGAKGARKREVDEAEEPDTGAAKKAKNLL